MKAFQPHQLRKVLMADKESAQAASSLDPVALMAVRTALSKAPTGFNADQLSGVLAANGMGLAQDADAGAWVAMQDCSAPSVHAIVLLTTTGLLRLHPVHLPPAGLMMRVVEILATSGFSAEVIVSFLCPPITAAAASASELNSVQV